MRLTKIRWSEWNSAVSASAFACAVLFASNDEISLLRLTQHATTEHFALTDDALRSVPKLVQGGPSPTPRTDIAAPDARTVCRPVGSTGYAGAPVPLATDHDIYAYLRLPVPAT